MIELRRAPRQYVIISEGMVTGAPRFAVGYTDDPKVAIDAMRALDRADACFGESFLAAKVDTPAADGVVPLPQERVDKLTAVRVTA